MGFFRRLGRTATALADEAAARGTARVRQGWRDMVNGSRFTCSCGDKGCPGTFRSARAQKAHAARVTATRWMSARARKAGRDMGKARDAARRHARGWLEAAGLRDHRGKATAKARARPELRGRVRLRTLREADRHDRHSEKTDHRAYKREVRAKRADARAGVRDQRADEAKARGRNSAAARHQARAGTHRDRADGHRQRGIDIRMDHHQRWPERTRT